MDSKELKQLQDRILKVFDEAMKQARDTPKEVLDRIIDKMK